MAHAITESELAPRRSPAPRCARWPWARASLSGLVIALLPFTWVVQLDGCTQTVEGRRTGIDLLRDVPLDTLDVGLALFLFALVVVTPWWAGQVERSMTRVGLHFAGFVATAALAF